MIRTACTGIAALMDRTPSATITATDAGAALRAELDGGGGNRTWLDVQIFVEDPAGGLTQVHGERLNTGDGPVEYIGPIIENEWRGRAVRLRITDPVTGETLADDTAKVRRS